MTRKFHDKGPVTAMKTLPLTVLLVLVLGCLNGCAILPASGDYYKPSASEGDVQGYGDYDAPTTLVLRRGKDRDMVVLMSGYFLGGSQVQNVRPCIEIRLLVPVGKALKTDLSTVRIYGDSSASIGKASPVYAMNRTRLHGDLKMDEATQAYSGDTLPAFGDTLFYTDPPIEDAPPKVLKTSIVGGHSSG